MADKTLATYIKTLISLSGSKATEEKLTELTEKLGDFELNEEAISALDQNVFLKDAAKNNTEIVNAIKAKTLNGFDANIDRQMESLGFSQEEIKSVNDKSNGNTYERMNNVLAIMKQKSEQVPGSLCLTLL